MKRAFSTACAESRYTSVPLQALANTSTLPRKLVHIFESSPLIHRQGDPHGGRVLANTQRWRAVSKLYCRRFRYIVAEASGQAGSVVRINLGVQSGA